MPVILQKGVVSMTAFSRESGPRNRKFEKATVPLSARAEWYGQNRMTEIRHGF